MFDHGELMHERHPSIHPPFQLPSSVSLPTMLPTATVVAPCPHDLGCPRQAMRYGNWYSQGGRWVSRTYGKATASSRKIGDLGELRFHVYRKAPLGCYAAVLEVRYQKWYYDVIVLIVGAFAERPAHLIFMFHKYCKILKMSSFQSWFRVTALLFVARRVRSPFDGRRFVRMERADGRMMMEPASYFIYLFYYSNNLYKFDLIKQCVNDFRIVAIFAFHYLLSSCSQ